MTFRYISDEEAKKIKDQEKVEYSIPDDGVYNIEDIFLETNFNQPSESTVYNDDPYDILNDASEYTISIESSETKETPTGSKYKTESNKKVNKKSNKSAIVTSTKRPVGKIITTLLSSDSDNYGNKFDIKERVLILNNKKIINGKVPSKYMSSINASNSKKKVVKGHKIEKHAAYWFNLMNDEYKDQFGFYLYVTDSYRTFNSQINLKKRKPRKAATPSTSLHGWGLAVDLGDLTTNRHRIGYNTKTYLWLKENAKKYYFENPNWAKSTGSNPEPWHWEYIEDDPYTDSDIG